jgi:hypothetical protein
VYGGGEADRGVHQAGADELHPGIAGKLAQLPRIVDATAFLNLADQTFHRVAANELDHQWQAHGRLIERNV